MKFTVGIDEAGRGPLAGPVAVAAFMFVTPNGSRLIKRAKLPLRDSKKLTAKQRDLWFSAIRIWKERGQARYAVSLVDATYIDTYGLTRAIQLALAQAIREISPTPAETSVYLDGGLKAPKRFLIQKTIIKGDEKIPVISLASICAKVTRDRHMVKLSKAYPSYNFYMHKGYGTKEHYKSLEKYGPCAIHRMRFLKRLVVKESLVA